MHFHDILISYRTAYLFVSICGLMGCSRENARLTHLHEQYLPTAQRKLALVDKIAADVMRRPFVPSDFVHFTELSERFGTYRRISEDPEMEPHMRETAREMLKLIDGKMKELKARIKLEPGKPVQFYDDALLADDLRKVGNAQTLLLADHHEWDRHHPDVADRNRNALVWLRFDQLDPTLRTTESLQHAARKLESLDYLLIVRPTEIVEPEYRGDNMFGLGGMMAEAHLYSLEDGEHLGAFVFMAATQDILPGIPDFTLDPDRPVAAVETLMGRLFDDTHQFAHATAAEISESISSPYRVSRRPLLGHTLEEVE